MKLPYETDIHFHDCINPNKDTSNEIVTILAITWSTYAIDTSLIFFQNI